MDQKELLQKKSQCWIFEPSCAHGKGIKYLIVEILGHNMKTANSREKNTFENRFLPNFIFPGINFLSKQFRLPSSLDKKGGSTEIGKNGDKKSWLGRFLPRFPSMVTRSVLCRCLSFLTQTDNEKVGGMKAKKNQTLRNSYSGVCKEKFKQQGYLFILLKAQMTQS